jgi:hypothetical protein
MICPGGGYCPKRGLCAVVGCLKIPSPAPLYRLNQPNPALHFVGFKDDRFNNAVRVFGQPDFVHRVWDLRAAADVAPDDTVLFAQYHDQPPTPYCFDDSNQPGDPAAQERNR